MSSYSLPAQRHTAHLVQRFLVVEDLLNPARWLVVRTVAAPVISLEGHSLACGTIHQSLPRQRREDIPGHCELISLNQPSVRGVSSKVGQYP